MVGREVIKRQVHIAVKDKNNGWQELKGRWGSGCECARVCVCISTLRVNNMPLHQTMSIKPQRATQSTHRHTQLVLKYTKACAHTYTYQDRMVMHTYAQMHHTLPPTAHTLPFLLRSNLLVSIPLSILSLSPNGPEIINLFLHSSYVSTMPPPFCFSFKPSTVFFSL